MVGEKEGSNSEKNTALSQLKEHTSEEQSTTVEKGKSVSLERDDFQEERITTTSSVITGTTTDFNFPHCFF